MAEKGIPTAVLSNKADAVTKAVVAELFPDHASFAADLSAVVDWLARTVLEPALDGSPEPPGPHLTPQGEDRLLDGA